MVKELKPRGGRDIAPFVLSIPPIICSDIFFYFFLNRIGGTGGTAVRRPESPIL